MKPVVAVSLGDADGVGPELVRRALRDPRLKGRARWILTGPGMKGLHQGIDLCLSGEAGALMTGPMSKARWRIPGQTEVLSERTGRPATMMLVGGRLRVALVTVHEPIARVPRLVTASRILGHLHRTSEGLARWFGIRRPRVAVLGLNPHAGEQGLLGREEIRTIAPAVRKARALGIRAEGPLPADGALGRWREAGFDAYLAMYHDQGLTALKAVAFSRGVNVTLGLPFLRTSPDHGTAPDLVGTGKADPGPTVEALKLAARAAALRA